MKIVYTDKHKLHNTDEVILEGYPFNTEEIPARAEVIIQAIRDAGWATIAPPADHGMAPILAVHDKDYIQYLQTVYAKNAEYYKKEEPVFTWAFANRRSVRKPTSILAQRGYYCFSWGSPILKGTWEAAYWSAQSALTAAKMVRDGENVVYALCRPPGHHSATDLYGGFCYLNNAAIAARFLGERVAILDIDYHHGNGTQSIFYEDPGVAYCSLHAHPDLDYPYFWGDADEVGEGPGKGTNLNLPLPLGVDDTTYLATLDQALQFISDFAPHFLIVSAGFDTVAGDIVGSFNLSTGGLQQIAKKIASLELPTIVLQEGGYLVKQLGQNVTAFLESLVG
ncbi:MAG: histone deacetylase family protein [Anaerolineales bacterium]|nr:histone deacetylase family protein [Anaerolineales bacterium]